jgi:hypothetical protein
VAFPIFAGQRLDCIPKDSTLTAHSAMEGIPWTNPGNRTTAAEISCPACIATEKCDASADSWSILLIIDPVVQEAEAI